MEIEEVFSSKSRMKILKLIYTLGQLNVSDVARRVKINFASTSAHLKILEAEGILEERKYGRVRMYRFSENPKAKVTIQLIEAWEQQ
jgi:DNA-binding transcriptional ArsR family regulator